MPSYTIPILMELTAESRADPEVVGHGPIVLVAGEVLVGLIDIGLGFPTQSKAKYSQNFFFLEIKKKSYFIEKGKTI